MLTEEQVKIDVPSGEFYKEHNIYGIAYNSLFFFHSPDVLIGTFVDPPFDKKGIYTFENNRKTYVAEGYVIGIAKDGFSTIFMIQNMLALNIGDIISLMMFQTKQIPSSQQSWKNAYPRLFTPAFHILGAHKKVVFNFEHNFFISSKLNRC